MKILNNRVAPINVPLEEINLPDREGSQPTSTEQEPRVQNDTAPEKKPDKTNPVDRIGLLSHLFYWWLLPLYWKGYKKKIHKDDIYDVPKNVTCKLLGFRLEKSWTNELLEAVAGLSKSPQFIRALCKAFGPSLIILILARLITDACLIGQALLLGGMVNNPHGLLGHVYSITLCLCSALYLLLHQGWTTMAVTTGLQIRTACSCLLYTKVMKLNLDVVQKPEVEDLLASVTKELELFDQLAVYLPYVIVGPIVAIIVTCILWDHLGASCLVGMIFLLLLITLQVFTGKRISKLTMLAGPHTEKRLRSVKEIAAGLVQIKQSAWEALFKKKIQQRRNKETAMLCKATFYHILISIAHSQGTKVMIILSISTFILLGNGYTVSKAFITVLAIQALRIPLCLYFPLGISVTAKVLATVEKMEKILLLNEYSGDHDQRMHREGPIYSRLILMDASAKWDTNSTQFTVNHINLGVQQGELLAVAGPEGGGKTSLLHMMLGELPPCSGKITVNGHCVYCPQKPWIFPSTLRKNITCGRPYREEHFKKVLSMCDLDEVMRQFADYDLTNIGEEGAFTLTVTQKAKVNLARTVYQEADIYLIDNPLIIMNLTMATDIFNSCIQKHLKAKTVVLVTDRPRFLQKADQILILKDGRMAGCGSYSILKSHGLELHRYVEYDKHGELDQEEEEGKGRNNNSSNIKNTLEVPQPDPAEVYSYCRKGSSEPPSTGLKSSVLKLEGTLSLGGDLLSPTAPPKILLHYIKVGTRKRVFTITVIGLILFLTLMFLWDYLYLIWTMNIDKQTRVTDEWFPEINANKHYYLIGLWCQIGAILIVGPLTFLAILYMLTTAATTVHDNMFDSMLYAPLKCLDSITLERILNAFSHDMKVLDEMIPPTLLELTQCIIMILGCLLVIMISSYWLIIPTIVLVISACIVANVCLPSTRALKKIEDMMLNSVAARFKSTLEGITVIRSLKAEEFFRKEYAACYDCHSSALCLMKCATHALGLWIGLFSVLYTACITLGYRMLVPDLKPAHLGLATYCSLVLTTLVPEAVKYCAHAGMQLASAGRIMQLSQLEHEELDASPSQRKEGGSSGVPPADWPLNGEIHAKNLTLQYSQHKPCVLQNLNFAVKPREKVGVVGCVGAGKSALLSALLRMAEPLSAEALWIDEVDISKIPLRLLRSRISVVPRFPILFSGQLRFNLDPDSTLADNVLWDALDKVKLCRAVQALPYGLQTESWDWDKVFTIHQRQLLCLARALIDGNRILILDMAMGNLDTQMEGGMLQVIRRHFTNSAVIIVSHRLRSIMKTDRVLVLEAGKMAESGHPYLLLQNEYSHFYKMVHQTGIAVKEQLIQLAREAYLGSLARKEEEEEEDK